MLLTPQAYFFIFGYTLLAFAIFLEPVEGEHQFFVFKFTNRVAAFIMMILFGIFWALTVNCMVHGGCFWWSWILCGYLMFSPLILMMVRFQTNLPWKTTIVQFYQKVSQ